MGQSGDGPGQLAEVVPAGTQHGVHEVSALTLETVPLHTKLMIHVTDHWLHGKAAFPPSPQGRRNGVNGRVKVYQFWA